MRKGSGSSVATAPPTTFPLASPAVEENQPVIDATPLAFQFPGGHVITLPLLSSHETIPFVPPEHIASPMATAPDIIYLVCC